MTKLAPVADEAMVTAGINFLNDFFYFSSSLYINFKLRTYFLLAKV